MGICTGSFAAAAISTSQTVSELIPAGVEAVLVAFRTGLRSLELRNEIERSIPEISSSWSVVISAQEEKAIQIIEEFSSAKVCFDNDLLLNMLSYMIIEIATKFETLCQCGFAEESNHQWSSKRLEGIVGGKLFRGFSSTY